MKFGVVSKLVMNARSLRNDVRQCLGITSKEYWAQDNLEEPRDGASIVKRPDTR